MNVEATKKRIKQILAKDEAPTPKEQRFIDQFLDHVAGEERRKQRLERAENYHYEVDHLLRKKNRIHKSTNRLSDYKNTRGNKERVRHPSKFKRLEGVLFLLNIHFTNASRVIH